PLGTGLVLNAHKKGLVHAAEVANAVAWMRKLNRDAADALRPLEPSAVTDITGFGLLGHAHEMAERSRVRLRLSAAALPALDGALELAERGLVTGGDGRNRDFAGPHVSLDGTPTALVNLAYDPQTAGGLLVSLPRERQAALEAAFAARGLFVRRIGHVEEGAGVVLA
ncbi:MAG: AIR synthase-related protein, partial [Actinomycetota bacterium]|nr:AIR synthase-related protein [Actinomycetota bacterium]